MRRALVAAALLLLPSVAGAISSTSFVPQTRRAAIHIDVDNWAVQSKYTTITDLEERIDAITTDIASVLTANDGLNEVRPASVQESVITVAVVAKQVSIYPPGYQLLDRWDAVPLITKLREKYPDPLVVLEERGDVHTRVGNESAVIYEPPHAGTLYGCPPGTLSHDADRSDGESGVGEAGNAVCTYGTVRACVPNDNPAVDRQPCLTDTHCPGSTCGTWDYDPAWAWTASTSDFAGISAADWPSGLTTSHPYVFCGHPVGDPTGSNCVSVAGKKPLSDYLPSGEYPIPYSPSSAPVDPADPVSSISLTSWVHDFRTWEARQWKINALFEQAFAYGYGKDGNTGKGVLLGIFSKWTHLPYYDLNTDPVTDTPECGGHPTIKTWWLPAHVFAGDRVKAFRRGALCPSADPECDTPTYDWRVGMPDCSQRAAIAGGPIIHPPGIEAGTVEEAAYAYNEQLLYSITRADSPLPDAEMVFLESNRYRDIDYYACDVLGALCRHPKVHHIRRLTNTTSFSGAVAAVRARKATPTFNNIIPCNDGIDNDIDGLTDLDDPDCLDATDGSEHPSDDTPPDPDPACADTLDNDGDGLTDYPSDPGCSSADDNTETSDELACDDGADNDSDELVDLADPGCRDGSDPDELHYALPTLPEGVVPTPAYESGPNPMDQYQSSAMSDTPDAFGFSHCGASCNPSRLTYEDDPFTPGSTPGVLTMEYVGDSATRFGVFDGDPSRVRCWGFSFKLSADYYQSIKLGGFFLQSGGNNHYLGLLSQQDECKPDALETCVVWFGFQWNDAGEGYPNEYYDGTVEDGARNIGEVPWSDIGINPFDNEWHRATACVDVGTPGNADGWVKLWIDNPAVAVIDEHSIRMVRPIGDHPDMDSAADGLQTGIWYDTTPRAYSQGDCTDAGNCGSVSYDDWMMWYRPLDPCVIGECVIGQGIIGGGE